MSDRLPRVLLVALAFAACVGISRGQGNNTYLVPLYSGDSSKAPTFWIMAFSFGTPGVLYSGTVGERRALPGGGGRRQDPCGRLRHLRQVFCPASSLRCLDACTQCYFCQNFLSICVACFTPCVTLRPPFVLDTGSGNIDFSCQGGTTSQCPASQGPFYTPTASSTSETPTPAQVGKLKLQAGPHPPPPAAHCLSALTASLHCLPLSIATQLPRGLSQCGESSRQGITLRR